MTFAYSLTYGNNNREKQAEIPMIHNADLTSKMESGYFNWI
jgi:hypothetical protein